MQLLEGSNKCKLKKLGEGCYITQNYGPSNIPSNVGIVITEEGVVVIDATESPVNAKEERTGADSRSDTWCLFPSNN